MTSRLSPENLEQLAGAAILAEVAQRFANTDPKAIVLDHAGVIESRAEELGLDPDDLGPDDAAAIAALVDQATAQVEVSFL